MGHYRSEMGYEEQDRRNAEIRDKRLADSAKKIQALIDEKGIAFVIAEMIRDPTMFQINYC